MFIKKTFSGFLFKIRLIFIFSVCKVFFSSYFFAQDKYDTASLSLREKGKSLQNRKYFCERKLCKSMETDFSTEHGIGNKKMELFNAVKARWTYQLFISRFCEIFELLSTFWRRKMISAHFEWKGKIPKL